MMKPSDDPRMGGGTRKELEAAIFETALGLEDPEAREAFLSHWFHHDPAGLDEMRKLMRASTDSTSFFIEAGEQRVVVARDAVDAMEAGAVPCRLPVLSLEEPGSRIGRYRINKRIGEGGCGVVYEAEQEEPVRRKVALKIIRLGMDTESVIERFEMERQALAMMDHRNIARVLDAGATETGRPYFVMELVKGEKITSYCDGGQLSVSQRLKLFIQVCHAIQHAHQKGIVHRDIKPSNILVQTIDGEFLPKVIDFGIAKAAGCDNTNRTLFTERDQIIGTPAYMSTEQMDLRGIDIDTRSDVYSLGAVLYELLTGFPPFDEVVLSKVGISEMRRMLLEDDPVSPSRRVANSAQADIASNRRTEPDRLVSSLRGDLNAIVRKALEKDRNRRYQTVNSLAMDIGRFLADEPVLASRPDRLYLIKKFIRRNRAACFSGALISISMLGGLSTATWLYIREHEALAEQKRLAQEAEIARAEEAHLREQAQARANVSRIAGLLEQRSSSRSDFAELTVLLDSGQVEAADALLQAVPLSSIEPSREAAAVLRSLGHWNAMRGQWEQARYYFLLLNQANRLYHPARILEGTDILCAAAILAEYGTPSDYEKFRQEIMARHLPVQGAIAAEHMLKSCLILPADKKTLSRLEQVARECESGARSNYSNRASHPHWDAFVLALFHYRNGSFEKTLEWSEKCLTYRDRRGDREAAVFCLRAMALHHAGEEEKALKDLAVARPLISPPPDPTTEPENLILDSWLDWPIARVLLREAENVCGVSSRD